MTAAPFHNQKLFKGPLSELVTLYFILLFEEIS